MKIRSALDNASNNFSCYNKHPRIHDLIPFECEIYPITPKRNKLYNITKEGSFMGYNRQMFGSTHQ